MYYLHDFFLVLFKVEKGRDHTKPKHIAMLYKLDFLFSVVVLLRDSIVSPRPREDPVIVVVLVRVGRDLLLSRAFGEPLDVRVEKGTGSGIVL
jgi:hypothetical protein